MKSAVNDGRENLTDKHITKWNGTPADKHRQYVDGHLNMSWQHKYTTDFTGQQPLSKTEQVTLTNYNLGIINVVSWFTGPSYWLAISHVKLRALHLWS